MIKTLLRVEQRDINTYGKDNAFCKVLSEWSILPWVDYLYKYGTIRSANHYVSVNYEDTYELIWELPPERETWFHLNYSKDIETIKRLT